MYRGNASLCVQFVARNHLTRCNLLQPSSWLVDCFTRATERRMWRLSVEIITFHCWNRCSCISAVVTCSFSIWMFGRLRCQLRPVICREPSAIPSGRFSLCHLITIHLQRLVYGWTRIRYKAMQNRATSAKINSNSLRGRRATLWLLYIISLPSLAFWSPSWRPQRLWDCISTRLPRGV